MDTGTAVVGIGVIISLFGYLEIIRRDLRSEIKEVRQASERAHNGINEKLSAIVTTQASHSERFNTVDERFNTVQTQIKCVDDKVDKLGNS